MIILKALSELGPQIAEELMTCFTTNKASLEQIGDLKSIKVCEKSRVIVSTRAS